MGWFALLLWPENLWVYLGGTVAGVLVSVWLCGEGERILGQHDPGSIVIDEIVAVPIAMAGVVFLLQQEAWANGALSYFFWKHPGYVAAGFALFRFFDIWKPWPVRQSQSLPRGWGVTMDDALAAIYVSVLMSAWIFWKA